MIFFEQANAIFREQGMAFALAAPGEKKILSWGKPHQGSTARMKIFGFHSKTKPNSDWWNGFQPLDQSLELSNFLFSDSIPGATWAKKNTPRFFENTEDWNSLCSAIEVGLFSRKFEKIVPARFKEATINKDIYNFLAENIFERLCALSAENTYKFAIRAWNDLFFGATPELLFKRRHGKIFVPAIAGTRVLSRGLHAEMVEELLNSEKDLREHEYVVSGIVNSLAKLGLKAEFPKKPEVKTYGSLLHLYTPIYFTDDPQLSSNDLVSALHPTPAIGGSPKLAAQEFLFENESWDRGLFASPILFSTPGEDLCLVAIRSALLRRDSLRFFAGAGFVEGSDPHKEWLETGHKMHGLESIFFEEDNNAKR